MDIKKYLQLNNEDLEKTLRRWNQQYREGNPEVSDEIYDYLYDVLKERDPSNYFLNEIGAPVIDTKNKVELPYKMFSLDKIKNEEKPFQRWKTKYPDDVVMSHKLDGNSGLLYIKNNKISLYTRGDGFVGQDISFLVPYISIFKDNQKVSYKKFILDNYSEFAIRGELILSKKDWNAISSAIAGLSNPRNTVAGTLNAKSPNPLILSKIRFVAYEWIAAKTTQNKNVGPFRPSESFDFMKKLGFEIVDYSIVKSKDVSLEVFSNYLEQARENGVYEIDGIVVSENKDHPRDDTGNPEYSFAFKSLVFQEQVEVTVTNVEWNVSKDGILKPLVHFPKVNLNGVDIQKATGFNAKFIEENKIGPGSTIVIIRSGDVIPHILKVLKSSPSGAQFPDINFVWNDTHVDIKINFAEVEDVEEEILEELEVKRLVHFFVKMETEGVAEGVVKKLYDAGFTTVKSILTITLEDLRTVEGIQQRSAEKIRMNIDLALEKSTPLKLMVASNMFEGGFGDRKLKLILEAFPEITNEKTRFVPNVEDMLNLKGIALITAEKFIENLPNFWNFVDENELQDLFKTVSKSTSKKNSKVVNKNAEIFSKVFVFSGFRNKEWQEIIESYGGKVGSSVSKNTDYLIVKDENESTTKTKKAEELNIPIWSEEKFSNYFN